MPMTIYFQYYHSPCGDLVLGAAGDELFLCDWSGRPCSERNKRRLTRLAGTEFKEESSPALERAERELDEYFAGLRTSFDIPLHPVGTPFQQSVWAALKEIPYGETRTYIEIARRVGNVLGVRAVAQAIGANGLSIFIPCHRVIGADNSLTGFAGGLKAKSRLLALESTRGDSPSLVTRTGPRR
jgi:methylated-DNA-[protein]-cysteine S-methyltransferase